MSRTLLLGASALAVALGVAAAPASAQLADVAIEGPIQDFPATGTGEVVPTQLGTELGGKAIVGTIKVMGVTVKVPVNAAIHTPTKENLSFEQFSTGAFPGRTDPGFKNGTAIISGDSYQGIIYAREVFSDMSENVVVGEATAVNAATGNVTIQNMDLMKSTDPRMPAKTPINGYGFPIEPTSIVAGTLVAAEGYYTTTGDVLRYHTIEADSASLVPTTGPQVSILRADCRIRGGGRDELSLRGGAHTPASGQVAITYARVPEPRPTVDADWATPLGGGLSGGITADPATTPVQGEWRYDNTRQNFPGRACPTLLRAKFNGAVTTFIPDIR